MEDTKKNRFTPDTITAIAATFIALIALGTAVWQGVESRNHNRLSVKPYLRFDSSFRARGEQCGVFLKNNGLGPAIIRDFLLVVDGEPITNTRIQGGWLEAAERLGIEGILPHAHAWRSEGYSMPVGENTLIFGLEPEDYNPEARKLFLGAMNRLSVVIEYESIYGDRFKTVFEPDSQKYEDK